MSLSHTVLHGEIDLPDFVREAANWVLKVDVSSDSDREIEIPFGSGMAAMHEVQPGLRSELHQMTCHSDQEFEFFSDPFIACNILLEGNLDGTSFEGLGIVEKPLKHATLVGFGEPIRWKRTIHEGQFFKSFGVTLQPSFLDRFASEMEDEQLSSLNAFLTGSRATILPKSQRLIDLGYSAFDHPYSGSLAALHQESNALQFILEFVSLHRDQVHLIDQLGRKQFDRLMHARTILDDSLVDPPMSLDLARQVGGNIKTLQAHFKLAFGITIFGYVRKRRLEMARILIKTHGLGSAEAGYRVGFSNPAAFSASYRRHFGYPPSRERR